MRRFGPVACTNRWCVTFWFVACAVPGAGAAPVPSPDAALPDAALPDAALPDAALPDAALPDAALPDAALPDAAVTGNQALTLDLDRAVALALARNPGLKAERERRREVEAGVDEVAADALPRVTVVSSWSRARSPTLLNSPDFEDIVEQIPGGFEPREQELTEVKVEVNQTLYNGGALGAAVRLAERVRAATEAQISAAELDVGASTGEAFHQCQAAARAEMVVHARQAARAQALASVEARYELGDATELERLRAQAALVSVAPTAARAAGRVAETRAVLRALLDLPATVRIACLAATDDPDDDDPDDRDPLDDSPFGVAPGARADTVLMAQASATRPELRDLAEQDHALLAQRAIAEASARPRLELKGSYGRQSRLVDNLESDRFNDWRVSIDLSWRIFDGGARRGRVAQIASQRTQTAWRRTDFENRIDAEVIAARAAHHAAGEVVRAARAASRVAREAERVAVESYELGVALLTDVLESQEETLRADLDAVEARAELGIASTRLARAVGQLPTQSLDQMDASSSFTPESP